MRLIIVGALFLIGGMSGTMVLRGTHSSGGLALVGIVMVVIGAVSMANKNNAGEGSSLGEDWRSEPTAADRERDAEQMAEYKRLRLEQAKAAQAKDAAAAKQHAVEELAKPWNPDPNDPRTQRLEAIFMMSPAARAEVEQVLSRTREHLDADAQLNLALETARRVRDGARA